MSLTFGGATSDRVNVGSGATLDDMAGITVVAWVYPTTLTTGRRFYSKTAAGIGAFFNIIASNNLQLAWLRATTNAVAGSSDGAMTTNAWQCIAGAFDKTATPKLYRGTLGAALAEVASYSTQTAGAGTFLSDAAADGVIGNLSAAVFNSAFQGRIAVLAVFNRALTLGELQAWQFRPTAFAGCVGMWWLGDNGTGSQLDASGNANVGTVTGATVDDNVPLGLGVDAGDDHSNGGTGGAAAVLEGAATISITGAGALSTSIEMQGAATIVVNGTGALTTAIPLAGAATLDVTATPAALSTGIVLAGAASVSLVGAGALSTAIEMQGAASITLAGAGSLSTAIPLLGGASVTFSASGDLGGGAAALAGAGTIALTAAGALTTAIALEGAASVTLTAATAALTTSIDLAGAATITFSTIATLTNIVAAVVVGALGKYHNEWASALADVKAAEEASYASEHASALADIKAAGS